MLVTMISRFMFPGYVNSVRKVLTKENALHERQGSSDEFAAESEGK